LKKKKIQKINNLKSDIINNQGKINILSKNQLNNLINLLNLLKKVKLRILNKINKK
jgi:hypothetical protein